MESWSADFNRLESRSHYVIPLQYTLKCPLCFLTGGWLAVGTLSEENKGSNLCSNATNANLLLTQA